MSGRTKIYVKFPLNSESKVAVHKHIWIEEIGENTNGQVVEGTICKLCGVDWIFRNDT